MRGKSNLEENRRDSNMNERGIYCLESSKLLQITKTIFGGIKQFPEQDVLAEFYKPYLTLFHRLLNQKCIKFQLKVFNTELAYFLDNVILI